MDKTQKIVTVLLILAILFSATSIFISVSISKLDIPDKVVSGRSVDNGGGIMIYVEGENEEGSG
ncbi:hypothetical protein CO038_03455 [Candidatus Pacearchaeota archaeon CG_4_9_14_0_2_um_filter_39_13]|nr:hypothetical protein [Candidatus Pacearchaeota archaeon]OIO44049.1 MAG: hypothetical protein AUJ64_00855 [Candidatus Pacearchaeota archaeon CG1_02_39_14]PJC44517.1 MAG: hypothetical protein CO038_03455 [Candidatus Pacearchaeota archaeon CG_4_9_14_0_2_um_filter_39_13]QBM01513.1 hypothetical protein [uncultured archaeon]